MSAQKFNTVDVLRLQVERLPTGSEVVNLVQNPSGELGSYGWETPVPGSLLRGSTSTNLYYTAAANVANYLYTEPLPVTAGQYAAARWTVPGASLPYHRAELEWLDSTYAVIGSSVQTGYLDSMNTARHSIGAFQAPAGTVYSRLRFDIYKDTSGGYPTGAFYMRLQNVIVAAAASSATLVGIDSATPGYFVDVLGPTHEISIDRNDLDVGTLTATILDATLDPASSTTIRPGRRVRLTTAAGDTIFTGKIITCSVKYDPLNKNTAKRAAISITAADAVAALANAARTEGVATIGELPYVLEGAGVPWNVNGSGQQVTTATVVADNPSASAIDEIVITRDSTLGYVWVDRFGVLQAWDRNVIDTTITQTLDESVYNPEIEIDYDTAGLVNSVTLQYLRLNAAAGTTETVTYGPYVDTASIAQWGVFHEDRTVQGIAESALPGFGASVLAGRSTPVVKINTVVVPINTSALLSRALVDLYDLVRVVNGAVAGNQRVTSISHSITPDQWLVTIGFVVDGSIASSTAVPRPPPVSTGTVGDPDGQGAKGNQDLRPNAPSAPTASAKLGTITVRWDGLDSTGAALSKNKNFDYVEVHRSTTNGFTPTKGGATRMDVLRFAGPSVFAVGDNGGAYNTTYYFKLIAVGRTGLASGPSAQASATMAPLVNTDLIGQVIAGANIVSGSIAAYDKIIGNTITGALIQALSIDSGKIQSNAITADKIEAGAITGVKIAAQSIYGDRIASGGINGTQIAYGAISTNHIQSNSITANHIQYGSITGSKIQSNSLSTDLITADAGSTIRFNRAMFAPTITAGGGDFIAQNQTGGSSATAIFGTGGKLIRSGSSSLKVKQDVEDIDIDAGVVRQMRPVFFRYKPDTPGYEDDRYLYGGFIAEELHDLGLTSWVTYGQDGEPDGVRYDMLSALLLLSERDLDARVSALEAAV